MQKWKTCQKEISGMGCESCFPLPSFLDAKPEIIHFSLNIFRDLELIWERYKFKQSSTYDHNAACPTRSYVVTVEK